MGVLDEHRPGERLTGLRADRAALIRQLELNAERWDVLGDAELVQGARNAIAWLHAGAPSVAVGGTTYSVQD